MIGVWQQVVVLNSYLMIFRLGIINAFNREYPVIGERHGHSADESRSLVAVTSFQTIVASVIAAIIFGCLAIYAAYQNDSNMMAAFLTIAIFCLFDSFSTFQESRLRSSLMFFELAKVKVIMALVLICSLVLPYLFDFVGMLVRVLFICLLLFLCLRYFSRDFKDRPRFILRVWRELFEVGWKIWIWSYLKAFNQNLPKLLILFFGTTELLGLFTPVAYLLVAFSLITASLNTYVYPRLSVLHDNAAGDAVDVTLRMILVVGAVCAVFAWLGNILLHFWFVDVLPQYASSLTPASIALWIAVLEVANLSATAWMSTRRWHVLYGATLLSVVVRTMIFFLMCGFNIADLTTFMLALLYSAAIIALVNVALLYKTRNQGLVSNSN